MSFPHWRFLFACSILPESTFPVSLASARFSKFSLSLPTTIRTAPPPPQMHAQAAAQSRLYRFQPPPHPAPHFLQLSMARPRPSLLKCPARFFLSPSSDLWRGRPECRFSLFFRRAEKRKGAKLVAPGRHLSRLGVGRPAFALAGCALHVMWLHWAAAASIWLEPHFSSAAGQKTSGHGQA